MIFFLNMENLSFFSYEFRLFLYFSSRMTFKCKNCVFGNLLHENSIAVYICDTNNERSEWRNEGGIMLL